MGIPQLYTPCSRAFQASSTLFLLYNRVGGNVAEGEEVLGEADEWAARSADRSCWKETISLWSVLEDHRNRLLRTNTWKKIDTSFTKFSRLLTLLRKRCKRNCSWWLAIFTSCKVVRMSSVSVYSARARKVAHGAEFPLARCQCALKRKRGNGGT